MTELTDNLIEEALEQLAQGKTVAEILELYPQSKDELGEILKTAAELKKSANSILPSQDLLINILGKISPDFVTNPGKARYTKQRTGSFLNIFSVWFRQSRYLIPAALVAIIAIVIGASTVNRTAAPENVPGYANQQAESLDQILQPLDNSADQTQAISDRETSFDQQMVLADAQSLNGLDQPYDDGQSQ